MRIVSRRKIRPEEIIAEIWEWKQAIQLLVLVAVAESIGHPRPHLIINTSWSNACANLSQYLPYVGFRILSSTARAMIMSIM